ncbi:DUF1329 domain-containing protein [Pseudomonas citronellolis]|uniref:DUF1329 domain-containing protein n=1 Tax=Pseudomonas citronellolis TaxID=53408 RepID=A0AAW6P9T4_9PSED|nr:DUF1329 domain-containing protein [Pseudomonas citronellolis]MDF3843484.1 DUF1329 domain-containing protein [Pseudomonas citronellolis]WAB91916.1 DUF1329 domain-containing protein [Pseudomonas citronellolis]WBG66499.1 DUF1329 domain-containing protein [Pseudomonas citronellolis]
MSIFTRMSLLALACAVLAAPTVQAAVTAEEAAKLKTTLTPLGAERAGNQDGSIPAWDGGYPADASQTSAAVPNLFAKDKPILTITAQNAEQYKDKLTEGTLGLLKRFPTFNVQVFQTRRTAAAPQWVYDNTFANATRATMDPSGELGPFPKGAYGGVPFPIPKNGEEAIWNHLLRWTSPGYQTEPSLARVTPEGKVIPVSQNVAKSSFPYYDPNGNLEKWQAAGSNIVVRRVDTSGPPIRAGEILLQRVNINDIESKTWVYLTGQRRVRRLPLTCCDVPSPVAGGILNFDEVEVYSSSIGRYDWKLVGKKEMYVPYNTNSYHQATSLDQVMSAQTVNPDFVRFEKHRVWVVEGTLKQGQRHVIPRLRVYLDEDTWIAVAGERWDAQGQLWKVTYNLPTVFPAAPGTIVAGYMSYDLIGGGYFASAYFPRERQVDLKASLPDRIFTPESLAGEGIR